VAERTIRRAVEVAALLAIALFLLNRPPASRPAGDAADDWFKQQRAFPRSELPEGALERAEGAIRALTAKSRPALALSSDTWVSIGPRPIIEPATRNAFAGRVTAIAPHPSDPDTIYIGTSHGGVWKTTDSGQTWSMITPELFYPAIRALAIDPVNPDILYAATQPGVYTTRFLRTTDAGRTWQQIPLKDERGRSVGVLYKILVDPTRAGNPAATTLYLQRGGWVYRTDDGGKTLRTILTMPDVDLVPNNGPEFIEDIAMDPAQPDHLFVISVPYVCTGSCANPDPSLILYRSLDGGDRWTKNKIQSVADILPETRIAASANAETVLVAFQDDALAKTRLVKSTDLGDTWSEITTIKPSTLAWPTAIGLAPGDGAIYLGNLGLHRSTNGGQSWSDMAAQHADQTTVVFDAAGRLLLGSDGGIFRGGGGPGSWTNMNATLPIAEIYGVAAHPSNGGRVLIGTQDNGTVELSGGSWTRVFGGDGGEVVYDPSGAAAYLETQWDSTGAYNFERCVDGATCVRRVAGIVTSDKAPFIPRFTIDPQNAQTVFLTAERLYRTDNGGALWTPVTESVATRQRCFPDDTKKGEPTCVNATYFTAVAVAPSSSQTVWAGTRNGDVWLSTNRGASWKSVADPGASPLPVRTITEIVVDPADPATVYVVYAGFDASGAGRGHIYKTADAGATWTNLSANLPDISANALLLDPDTRPRVLYLGTDAGVLRMTDDGRGSWEAYSNGLPPVVVTRFAYNKSTRTLLAATYGRGVWAISDRFAAARR